jgi:type II secretory pathway pseudopilin PulG
MIASRSHRRRGFTLTEMLAILILLSAFAIIATRLFTTSVKLTYKLGNAQDAAASVDGAMALLRSDVAAAKEVKVADEAITLDAVTWTLDGQHLLRRDSARVQSWRAPSAKLTFSTDGRVLVLKIGASEMTGGFGEIWLADPNQVLEKLTQP